MYNVIKHITVIFNNIYIYIYTLKKFTFNLLLRLKSKTLFFFFFFIYIICYNKNMTRIKKFFHSRILKDYRIF